MGRTSESEGVGEHSCSPWSMCGCGWCSSLVFSRVPPSRAPSSRVSSSHAPSSRVPPSCVLPSRVPSSCVPPSRVLPSRVPSSRVPSSCVLFFLGWPSSWGSPLSGVALFLGGCSTLRQELQTLRCLLCLWIRGAGDVCGTSWGERSLGNRTQSRLELSWVDLGVDHLLEATEAMGVG